VDAAAPPRPTLPRTARVRARAEFDRVFAGARRTSDPLLALHWLRDAAPARLGLAVSRKVDVRAVGRNRVKRVLRDEFRRLRAQLPPGAYVLVARPSASRADNPALRGSLHALLRRAGALPASGAGGTMPAAACPPGASPPSP
jgi:ribonuclease P protein component